MKSNPSMFRQRGAVALVITLLVLIAITIGSFAMVQTSTFENRMTTNDERSRQALQAAQAGIDYVLAHLSADPSDPIVRASLCATDTLETYGFQLTFRGPFTDDGLNFDPVAHHESCITTPFDAITTLAVWSRGYSEDRESVRTLVSTLDLTSPWDFLYTRLERSPTAGEEANPPVRSLGNVVMNGTPITGLCDLDAASAYFCWDLDNPGKATTGGYLIDGLLVQAAGDIAEGAASPMGDENFSKYDSELLSWTEDPDGGAARLFEETFGVDMDTWLASGNIEQGDGGKALPSGATGKVYIDGDLELSGNDVLGTPTAPVQLVVTGDLSLRGNSMIYGTVYAGAVQFGNPSGKGGVGTVKIMGTISSVGDVSFSGNASVFTPPEGPEGGDPIMPLPAELNEILTEYAEQREVSIRVGSWREVRN